MTWHSEQDEQQKVTKLDQPLRASFLAQEKYLTKLGEIDELLRDSELDSDSASYVYQLVLQLRLCDENVLKNILGANKGLCLALGVEPHASFHKNIDILISQLGFDNFYGEFSILGHLVDKLSKALGRMDHIKKIQLEEKLAFDKLSQAIVHDKEPVAVNSKEAKKTHSKRAEAVIAELRSAIGLQSYFALCISQLTEAYHAIPGLPKFGIIYDYLAGIRGPMEQRHLQHAQSVQLSQSMLKTLSKTLEFKAQANFNQLLHQANQSLDKLYQQQKSLQHDYINQKQNLQKLAAQYAPELAAKNNAAPAPSTEPKAQPAWKLSTLNLFNR